MYMYIYICVYKYISAASGVNGAKTLEVEPTLGKLDWYGGFSSTRRWKKTWGLGKRRG